jgi:hypothetical protein
MELPLLEKYADEEITFAMPFSHIMPIGDSVVSITSLDVTKVSGTGTLLNTTPETDGSIVTSRYSGGILGDIFLIEIEALTANGDSPIAKGLIQIV